MPVKSSWPPEGNSIICKVIGDTSVSSIGAEKKGNNGGAVQLKLKGHQEMIILNIDPQRLKGKIITGALLHFKSASPQKAPVARLGVSSVATNWTEGDSKRLTPQKGGACFIQTAYEKTDWTYPGSTIMDAVFGRGNTIWGFAESTFPDQSGWQNCAIAPDVISARVAGLSHGFCLFDEVGNIWSIKNKKFTYTYFPNRRVYSTESKGNEPWMEIWYSGTDDIPPAAVTAVWVETRDLPPGEAVVSWDTPPDEGKSKTLGFHVLYRTGNQEKKFPGYLIPMAKDPGEQVKMHIKDLSFKADQKLELEIRPVDGAGNIGKPFTQKIQLSSHPQSLKIKKPEVEAFIPGNTLVRAGDLQISVLDLLDKIDPITGGMIPERHQGYKGGNHLYSAKKKLIRLQGARNEHVAFQVNFEGQAENISVSFDFNAATGLKTKIYEFGYVHADKKRILPDPLIPLNTNFSIPSRAGNLFIKDQSNHSLILEVYIPHEVPAGEKRGAVIIKVGNDVLKLDVNLLIWNFTLPNKLSFIPEMNAYNTANPFKSYEYYRLAHEHRTCMNRLPYSWSGKPAFSPSWDGKNFDWKAWDKHMGPLLDGSAFKDLPRKNEPVDVMYLPFNENWPVNIYDHYSPSYWADEAFTKEYANTLKNAFSFFAEHCSENEWHDTIFQFYLNNKIKFRTSYKKSSAPWLFDEPMNTQDFWALQWYGLLWRTAVDPVKGQAKMWYRGDISYGQFKRDLLNHVMDVEYIGGNNAQKNRIIQDEKILWNRSPFFSEYGSANAINASNIQPVLWCLSTWSENGMGVLPWQTIGTKDSWVNGKTTTLFYPHDNGPRPSVRLKAFTIGQQYVEYLTIFHHLNDKPFFEIIEWIKAQLDIIQNNITDAEKSENETDTFENTDLTSLWKLRYVLGDLISQKGPEYKRAYVERQGITKSSVQLQNTGYVNPSPQVPRYVPECDRFMPD